MPQLNDLLTTTLGSKTISDRYDCVVLGEKSGLRATKCWGRSPELPVGDQVAKEGNSVRSATLVVPICTRFTNGQGHAQKKKGRPTGGIFSRPSPNGVSAQYALFLFLAQEQVGIVFTRSRNVQAFWVSLSVHKQ